SNAESPMPDAPHDAPTTARALPHALERLLARVRTRMRGLVWLHGIGTSLAIASGVLVFAFAADYFLHLPEPIRWFHLALLATLTGYFVFRDLWRPLQRVPDRTGLAVLVERAHPELKQIVVSAVELGTRTDLAQASGSAERVRAIVADAEAV